MKKLLLLISLLLPAAAQATPSVSSVSGTAAYGATLDIIGANFNAKPNQQQTYCYANFEDPVAGVACSSWSFSTGMGDIQNIIRKTDTCLDGTGCVGPNIDIGSNQANTANVSITDVGVGGKIYWGWDWNWTGGGGTYPLSTVNWKTYRAWPGTVGQQNDFYGGGQIDGGFVNFVESHDQSPVNGVNRFYTSWIRPPIGSWEQMIQYNQLNSATNLNDGAWQLYEGGQTQINTNTWQSNTSPIDSPNGRYRTLYPVHMVMTGSNFPAGGNFRFDNIIVETSYCVVWLSTVSTNMITARRNYMVVQTWATGEITAVWAQKSFTPGSTVYLYVQENGGTINASGFPITVAATSGGGGTPPLQPTEANQFCPCLP